jgi:hypothetical protein
MRRFHRDAPTRSRKPTTRQIHPGGVVTSTPTVSNPMSIPKRSPTSGSANTSRAVAFGAASAMPISRCAWARSRNEAANPRSVGASGAPASVATAHAAATARHASCSGAGCPDAAVAIASGIGSPCTADVTTALVIAVGARYPQAATGGTPAASSTARRDTTAAIGASFGAADVRRRGPGTGSLTLPDESSDGLVAQAQTNRSPRVACHPHFS